MATARKKVTAERGGGSPSASLRLASLEAARALVAAELPGAEVNAKFGGASFFVDGKVFAFSRPKGLVMKLPPEKLAEILATREAERLTMGKRIMREWILLRQESQEAYEHEVWLLRCAMEYVRSVPNKRR